MPLDSYSDRELSEELTRRKRIRDAEYQAALNDHYGHCPECGGELAEVEQRSVQEHWTAPGWGAWPMEPPAEWPGRRLVAQEWDTRLVCTNGHERWADREVRFSKEAAAQREP